MVFVGITGAAVETPNDSYDTGTWTGSINTWTHTGEDEVPPPVNAKYWEYEGVTMPKYYDTTIPYAAGSWGWFTQKYTADQPFSKMTLRYSYGVIKSSGEAAGTYVDISTDNINWTRALTIPGGWPAYLPTDLQTFKFDPTTVLYVRHGAGGDGTDPLTTVYEVVWRIFPSWDPEGAKGGVTLYESQDPATCAEALAEGYSIVGDFNDDCRIDLVDFSAMATNWLYCNVPGEAGCDTPWLD